MPKEADRRASSWHINIEELTEYPIIDFVIEEGIELPYNDIDDTVIEAIRDLTRLGWKAQKIAALLELDVGIVSRIQNCGG